MTKNVFIRSEPAMIRKHPPLLYTEDSTTNPQPKARRRFTETAGGTAAEVAAVCCCCPCLVVDVMILAVYRVPVRLCRKTWNNNKQKCYGLVGRKSLIMRRRRPAVVVSAMGTIDDELEANEKVILGPSIMSTQAVNLEELEDDHDDDEMWPPINWTGFWRGSSRDRSNDWDCASFGT